MTIDTKESLKNIFEIKFKLLNFLKNRLKI